MLTACVRACPSSPCKTRPRHQRTPPAVASFFFATLCASTSCAQGRRRLCDLRRLSALRSHPCSVEPPACSVETPVRSPRRPSPLQRQGVAIPTARLLPAPISLSPSAGLRSALPLVLRLPPESRRHPEPCRRRPLGSPLACQSAAMLLRRQALPGVVLYLIPAHRPPEHAHAGMTGAILLVHLAKIF